MWLNRKICFLKKRLFFLISFALAMHLPTMSFAAVKCVDLFYSEHRLQDPSFLNKIETEKVEVVNSPIATVTTASESTFVNSLRTIQQELSRIKTNDGVSDSAVLYPMAGYDSFSPLVLFPEAKVYILIDQNSAISNFDLKNIKQKGIDVKQFSGNSAWVHFSATGAGLLYKLLASVRSVHPKNQIKNVRFVKDNTLDNYSAIIDFFDFRSKSYKKIYFCAGHFELLEGTQINPEFRPWWEEVINYYQPRNILLKGSQSQLRVTHKEDSDSREKLFKYLKKFGGILVEGASHNQTSGDLVSSANLNPNRTKWEGSDGDPELSGAKLLQEIIIDGVEFSYSNKVRIGSYEGARSGDR